MHTVVLVMVLAGLLAAGAVMVQWQRHRVFALVAARLNLRFVKEDYRSLLQRLGPLYCMQKGHSRRALHVIQGRWRGRCVLVFDFHYELGVGVLRRMRQFTIVASQIKPTGPQGSCTGRTIPAETAMNPPCLVGCLSEQFDQIGHFLYFQPWTLPAMVGMEHRWDVHTDRPDCAREMLTADLLAQLDGLPCPWEFEGRWLILTSPEPLSGLQMLRYLRQAGQCCKRLEERFAQVWAAREGGAASA